MYEYPAALLEGLATGERGKDWHLVDLFKLTLGANVYRWASGDADRDWETGTYNGRSPLVAAVVPMMDTHRQILNVGIADPDGTWKALITAEGDTGNPIEHRHCILMDGSLSLVRSMFGVTGYVGTTSGGDDLDIKSIEGGEAVPESDTVIVCTGNVLEPGQVIQRRTSDHMQRENIDPEDYCFSRAHLLDFLWSVRP